MRWLRRRALPGWRRVHDSGEVLYKALQRCYPAAFRKEYGKQMLLVFDEQIGEARRTGGARKQAALWMQATSDAFMIAPKEHWNVIFARRTVCLARHGSAARIRGGGGSVPGAGNRREYNPQPVTGVVRSPLPGVRHPEELVILSNPESDGMWQRDAQGEQEWLTFEEFEQVRDRAGSFSVTASQSSLWSGTSARTGCGKRPGRDSILPSRSRIATM